MRFFGAFFNLNGAFISSVKKSLERKIWIGLREINRYIRQGCAVTCNSRVFDVNYIVFYISKLRISAPHTVDVSRYG